MTSTPITDQTARDVLTTALEGGYAEEFVVLDLERDPDDYTVLWAKVRLAEGYEVDSLPLDWTETLDVLTIRNGFRRFTKWVQENDPAHRSYLGEQWAIAHDSEGSGWDELDAIGADAVLQFACFGEVVFG